MLRQFGEQIWTVAGPTLSIAGFDYPTRSVIIRLADGGLFIWSPTALDRDLKAAIDQLGPVRHIVAPNTLHHKFIPDWHRAYREAGIHALPAVRARYPDLAWSSDLGDAPAPAWANDIDQVVVRGNWIATEVVFFHRGSRTAIFTDLIQQFEPGWFSGWRALVARLDLLTATEPSVPRKFRMAFHDRRAARDAVRRIIAWPTEAILAAHAAPVTRDGREVIARAFAWLLR